MSSTYTGTKKKKWFRPLGHVYTMLVVIVGFVMFRADTLRQGFCVIAAMFSPAAGSAAANAELFA